MVLSWFNTSKVDAFVDAEIGELVRRVPVSKIEAAEAGTRKAGEQLTKAREHLLRQTQAFVQREKPNFYQKARIANRMKWALMEAKYPKGFVDELAYGLAAVAAGANAGREI